jgi:hypothetical protein
MSARLWRQAIERRGYGLYVARLGGTMQSSHFVMYLINSQALRVALIDFKRKDN